MKIFASHRFLVSLCVSCVAVATCLNVHAQDDAVTNLPKEERARIWRAEVDKREREKREVDLAKEERDRIWQAAFDQRRREKLQADEKLLRDLLEKIKRFVELDDFSVAAVERMFGLKLEFSQTLEHPDQKVFGPRNLYIATAAEFPLSTECPEKGRNLNPDFKPLYWYQSTEYSNGKDKNFSLYFFYSSSIWSDVNKWKVTESVLNLPEWIVEYDGPGGAVRQPTWYRVSKTHKYSLSFARGGLRASDNCDVIGFSRTLK